MIKSVFPAKWLLCSALVVICVFLLHIPSARAEKTIGVIMTGNTPYYKEIYKAFTEALGAEGLGSAEVVLQTPNPEPMSWTNASRKLVAIGSDVIVSFGAPATLAVLHETSDTPVVFTAVYDPQAVGISGRNVTGISSKISVSGLIRSFRGIDRFSTLGIIYNESEKDTILQVNEVKQLEGNFSFRSMKFNVRRAEDTARIGKVDALLLTTSCAAMHCVNNVAGIARKLRIPTASTIGGGENSGIILTVAANPTEQGREAARMTARILQGAKPSSIPFEQPRKVDMIINLKEATDMGLKIPFDLLTSATKVIK